MQQDDARVQAFPLGYRQYLYAPSDRHDLQGDDARVEALPLRYRHYYRHYLDGPYLRDSIPGNYFLTWTFSESNTLAAIQHIDDDQDNDTEEEDNFSHTNTYKITKNDTQPGQRNIAANEGERNESLNINLDCRMLNHQEIVRTNHYSI